MKILYNLAKQKKPDIKRFISFTGIMGVIGCALILFGVLHQISYRKKYQEKLNQLDIYRTKIRDLSKSVRSYREEIKVIRKKWDTKVQYANRLIQSKEFSYVDIFDSLENVLPEGVLLSNLSISLSSGNTVSLGVIARSYTALNETYNTLMKHYHVSIRSESQSMQSFHAQLEIRQKK